MSVFEAQITGIIFYLCFAKVFKMFVRRFNRRNESDPFQKILYNKNTDFLETDNFFMNIYIIQIMNIVLGFIVTFSFEKKAEVGEGITSIFTFNNYHNYVNRSFEFSGLIIWTWLIWRGTEPKLFYSKCNAIILLIAGFLIVSSHIIGTIIAYKVTINRMERDVVALINTLN